MSADVDKQKRSICLRDDWGFLRWERPGTAPLGDHPRPGFFLTTRTWLDEDGRHVWVAHDCRAGRVTSMLPWPTTWQANSRGEVEPSLSCGGCGLHTSLAVDAVLASPVVEREGR